MALCSVAPVTSHSVGSLCSGWGTLQTHGCTPRTCSRSGVHSVRAEGGELSSPPKGRGHQAHGHVSGRGTRVAWWDWLE